jgi:hypothetical protein
MSTLEHAMAAANLPPAGPASASAPAPASASAEAHTVLGLLEVLDRSSAILQRLPIVRWPVTVGRALHADLVLDDLHVAPEHVRIEATAPGALAVHVLDTVNGVQQAGKHYPRDTQFNWLHGQELGVGRLRLRLRLAEQPLAPEVAMPRFDWHNLVATLALLALVLGLTWGEVWLAVPESSQFMQKLGFSVGLLMGVALLWAGVWALATKLFTGQPQFWRHVRIVLGSMVAVDVLMYLATFLGFSLGWDGVSRFHSLSYVLAMAGGLYLQLRIVAEHRRTSMAVLVLFLAVACGAAMVWKDRNQSAPYMAALYPPSWRLAQPVPVAQWLQEAGSLRQRLDARLQNDEDDDTPGPDDDTEE